jgi:hypothetical protein
MGVHLVPIGAKVIGEEQFLALEISKGLPRGAVMRHPVGGEW